MRVGIVGCPPEDILDRYRSEELVDLDNDFSISSAKADELLPKNVCAIIRRIVKNAFALHPELIVFDEGYGKCDFGRYTADILCRTLKIPVERTKNANLAGKGTPLSDSDLPLREKIELILDDLLQPRSRLVEREEKPKAAIWGVPAADFSVYDLFPPGTMVLGWARCLENRTPSDEGLESRVVAEIPTVFLAQTFCAKNILARNLAREYKGLYVDIHDYMTSSVKAKIEAFLKFRLIG